MGYPSNAPIYPSAAEEENRIPQSTKRADFDGDVEKVTPEAVPTPISEEPLVGGVVPRRGCFPNSSHFGDVSTVLELTQGLGGLQ